MTDSTRAPCPYCGTGPCLEAMPRIPGTTAREHPGCYALKRDTEAAVQRSQGGAVSYVPASDRDAWKARAEAAEAERDALRKDRDAWSVTAQMEFRKQVAAAKIEARNHALLEAEAWAMNVAHDGQPWQTVGSTWGHYEQGATHAADAIAALRPAPEETRADD